MPVDVISVAGTTRDIGLGFGRALAGNPTRCKKFCDFVRKQNSEVRKLSTYSDLAENALFDVMKQGSPGLVEWIEGFASSTSLSTQAIFLFGVGAYFRDLAKSCETVAEGCSTFAVSDSDNGPLIAKNRDCNTVFEQWQTMALVLPERGYGYMTMTTYGVPGVNSSGMNECGLAIADTHVVSTDIGVGLPRYAVCEKVLTQCEQVEEAIALVAELPLMGRGNLLVVDENGSLAVLELGHRTRAFRLRASGRVVNTNHFTDPDLGKSLVEKKRKSLGSTSKARYEWLDERLKRGCVDLMDAKAMLAHHGSKLDSICRHHDINPPVKTISGVVYAPEERRAEFVGGYPCTGEFQELTWS